ncbi:Cysteine-rich receptor-like protein kinase 29 [Morella rubra]|uniref:Cysteine-rich receptor-like protein kinase 29 n=1 Tax=Morella rubra TaxID=262757 RepID=A0A6A1ULF6_9ROSI|nr:Cysteine-rich receptor-like protein kinase 29 [Morella rubra]
MESTVAESGMQCTPDLSEQDCNDCWLEAIEQDIPQCCNGTEGGRIFKPSCNISFEVFNFLLSTTDWSPPSTQLTPPVSPPSSTNTSRTTGVALAISICFYLRVRRPTPRKKLKTVDQIISAQSLQFDFDCIKAATDNFSVANKLGQGGFGVVHKGELCDGQIIAVERLSSDSGQGDLEFKNEDFATCSHTYFTCINHILAWTSRSNQAPKFALGKALQNNIEGSFMKILDFVLSTMSLKLEKLAYFANNIDILLVICSGYMAPEYVIHGQFSVKSDVFSFGVLTLEIVSGQRNSCFQNGENEEYLLSYERNSLSATQAWRNWMEGTASNIIDPTIKFGSTTEIMRCIHIALLCVQENVANRPTMASVVLMLNSYSITLSAPSRPALFMHSTNESQMPSNRLQASVNEASITELDPC